jgi:hypothetical protein
MVLVTQILPEFVKIQDPTLLPNCQIKILTINEGVIIRWSFSASYFRSSLHSNAADE